MTNPADLSDTELRDAIAEATHQLQLLERERDNRLMHELAGKLPNWVERNARPQKPST